MWPAGEDHDLAVHHILLMLGPLREFLLSLSASLHHHSKIQHILTLTILVSFFFLNQIIIFFSCKILKEQIERYSERIYIFLL